MTERRSIFSPLGQRVYGIVQIATGLGVLLLGKHGPNWTLQFVMWATRYRCRKEDHA